MANIGWGKCTIFFGAWSEDGKTPPASLTKMDATPAQDSTVLSVTKGSKTEAKVEGGANEDVKYDVNNYTLTFRIRAAKNRQKPIADINGIVKANYAVAVQPEDENVDGFEMNCARVSVADGFSTSEGGYWEYTFDALIPEGKDPKKDKMIEWKKITYSAGEAGE